MARNITTQDVSWFLDLNERGQLDLDPPYQRRSVWSPRDKRFFIDTVFNNYPAPPIFLHKTLDDHGRPTYHVVDGKQRLQTIIEFQGNRIRIPDDFADVNLQKKRWNDLERSSHELFWNYVVSVEFLPDVSDASLRNIFDRINRNSRKLMPQEMRHAKYDGWFIRAAEAEAEKQEWKDFGLATAARMKRMADVQFISELFQVILRGRIEGFDQDALDDLYAEYEDLSEKPTFIEEEFTEEVERIKLYFRDALQARPTMADYLKVQAHFYSLWCYVALERARLLSPGEFAAKYAGFLHEVSAALETPESTGSRDQAVVDYAATVRGASTDLTPRAKRYNALVRALHEAQATAHEGH